MDSDKIRVITAIKTIIIAALAGLNTLVNLLALRGAWGGWKYVCLLATLAALAAVFGVVTSGAPASAKLSWAILILLFPLSGCVCYALWGSARAKTPGNAANAEAHLKQDPKALDDLADGQARSQAELLRRASGFPAYQNTRTVYFNVGGEMLDVMLSELQKAKKFIFMESFMVEQGLHASGLLEVLEAKAAEGVETRVIYDHLSSAGSLPPGLIKRLAARGISCAAFNPPSPNLRRYMNTRDLRRFLVIDGNAAFTGSASASGEAVSGAGALLRGEAVWSFTVMFLTMWGALAGAEADFTPYRPTLGYLEETGFVAPFGGPAGGDHSAGSGFIRLISTAREYVYIRTPRLAPDSDLTAALALAVLGGADVRVIVPSPAGGALARAETRAFCDELAGHGVHVYECAPGAVHATTLCSDDKTGFIVPAALDARSLAHAHTCGVWIYDRDAVLALRGDFLAAQAQATPIVEGGARGLRRLFAAFLRLIAPLI